MKGLKHTLLLSLFLLPVVACGEPSRDPEAARIVTADLDRFWKAWDIAMATDDPDARAKAFFEHYYLPGSPGLRDFIHRRIHSAFQLAETIDRAPEYYASLRKHTPKAAAAAEPASAAFKRLAELYPEAVFPDVYIVMGRMTSAGTTGPSGLLIGADMYGRNPGAPLHEVSEWHRSVLQPMEDLPFIIAHELIHYQQPQPANNQTLLQMVYREGSADFVSELIAGRHINTHIHEWAIPREDEIWERFSGVMEGNDLAGFLYGNAPAGWPADVGYFIGYRIAEAYYGQAEDKQAAVAEILRAEDVERILEQSGYGKEFNAPL